MGPQERLLRAAAASTGARGRGLLEQAAEHDLAADLLALVGVDLSVEALFRPGPDDALLLRGEG